MPLHPCRTCTVPPALPLSPHNPAPLQAAGAFYLANSATAAAWGPIASFVFLDCKAHAHADVAMTWHDWLLHPDVAPPRIGQPLALLSQGSPPGAGFP